MSKSLRRVVAAAETLGLSIDVRELKTPTRTAAEAAAAIGAELDQIVKSIIFCADTSNSPHLFLTVGGNRVDQARASDIAGEPFGRADASYIREKTGFAIGGVSPIGHTAPVSAYLDPRVFDFGTVWAAAGTPHHMFAIEPAVLMRVTGAKQCEFTGMA